MPAFPALSRGLYAIVDPEHCAGRDPERVAQAILAGGCAVLQLRAKLLSARAALDLAGALAAHARAAGVPFVVNDRIDLALVATADGVHLGQDDVPVAAARRLAPGLVVGLSTHDLAQVRAACSAGADAIGFGPVFPTTTKERPDPVVGLDGLAAAVHASPLPVIAIGGLTLERAGAVHRAGARWGAAISAVCAAADPGAAARALHAALRGERAP